MENSMNNKSSILIVDDDEGMCETLADILEDKGYRPVVALDGYEAVVKVHEADFDAILMDIRMPEMNGVETLKKIRKIHPEAMVVMMTAYAVEDLITEALREGAYSVLHKPLDMERVIGLIEGMKKEEGTVLMVDDDPVHCTVFKDVLEERDCRVSIASNVEEAIEMAREIRYDLIFMDMRLPDRNGLEAYLTIREVNPQSITVMMTAYPQEMDDLLEEALEKDVYACLRKPVDVEEVIQLVDEICRQKH
jgi:two-component system response regulator HydG